MWGWRSSRTFVIGAAGVIFAVCCLLPVAYFFTTSLTGIDAGRTRCFSTHVNGRCSTTRPLLGVGVAALSTAIGAPLGVALARVPLKRKDAIRVVLAAPMLLPPYVVALAWTYFGPAACSRRSSTATSWRRGRTACPAAIVVLSLVFYPLSMLASEAGLRRIDGRLEEAALVVASPRRVLRRITLPLAAPPSPRRRWSSSCSPSPSSVCPDCCACACTRRRCSRRSRRSTTFHELSCWPFRCWRCAPPSVRSLRGCWGTASSRRGGSRAASAALRPLEARGRDSPSRRCSSSRLPCPSRCWLVRR